MPMWDKKNGAVIIIYPGGMVKAEDGSTYRAIPVPDHGRLIDADALCNRLLTAWGTADKEKKTLISAVMADVVTPIVVGTPTIIPADNEDAE